MSTRPKFEDVALAEMAVLYRVARRLTMDDVWAEDLVGQTLLQAAKGWSGFDGRYPRSWLIRILQNVYRKDLRRASSRPATVPLEDYIPESSDTWASVNWRLVGEFIQEELDKLPDEYKLAVTLCDVEEMTYDEAAEALGVPQGTVKSRLFRGRRLLRQRLAVIQPGLE
ncbi:MAG: RNA polymerase sigma factor [Fimbriimonadaceae bacterium]|nr:RNA polymerase sigma factor [Fimbriimonadaceae bacterium]